VDAQEFGMGLANRNSVTKFNPFLEITMAVTKKSLISNTSKQPVKKVNTKAAATAVTAAKMATAFKATMRASRVAY
jgi:hypothetical protein